MSWNRERGKRKFPRDSMVRRVFSASSFHVRVERLSRREEETGGSGVLVRDTG